MSKYARAASSLVCTASGRIYDTHAAAAPATGRPAACQRPSPGSGCATNGCTTVGENATGSDGGVGACDATGATRGPGATMTATGAAVGGAATTATLGMPPLGVPPRGGA